MTSVYQICRAGLCVLLSAFITVISPAQAQPADVFASEADGKWIAAAAPHVEASLTKPIDQLYAAGVQAAPYDAMTFGLALLAGRSTDGNFSEDDRAALLRLEERVTPIIDAYQKKHPNKNILRINWHRKLKITDAETALVNRYQAAYLPDYWLAGAMVATKATVMTKNYRATTSDLGKGRVGTAMTSDVYYDRIIPVEVIITGAQCVAAVRKEAGLLLQPLHDHPISVLVVRSYKVFDIEAALADQVNTRKVKGPVGRAACGTTEQFDAHLVRLKASTAQ